jgi:hypothetical protein
MKLVIIPTVTTVIACNQEGAEVPMIAMVDKRASSMIARTLLADFQEVERETSERFLAAGHANKCVETIRWLDPHSILPLTKPPPKAIRVSYCATCAAWTVLVEP